LSKATKKKIVTGKLYVEALYNNTKVSLTDSLGNVIFWSSCGALGFKGSKKGTPFAASKVGDLIGEKAALAGVREVDVIVTGVGSGRESVIRTFMSHGIDIKSIQDRTPVPHNGPKAKKVRRV
jgi:small subunit ribosomal protein S11